jgi:hypothetical protein
VLSKVDLRGPAFFCHEACLLDGTQAVENASNPAVPRGCGGRTIENDLSLLKLLYWSVKLF